MFRSRSANVVSISASLTLSSSVCFFSGRSSCNLSTFAWLRSSFFLMDWTFEGIFSTSWLNSSMSSSTWDFSSKWRLQVGQLGFTSYMWLADLVFIFLYFLQHSSKRSSSRGILWSYPLISVAQITNMISLEGAMEICVFPSSDLRLINKNKSIS